MGCSPLFLGQSGNELQAREIIGDESIAAFENFCRYIEVSPARLGTGYEARIAPSVVVRGELQLFNLDIPRFCLRVYLSSDHNAFINLRRMPDVLSRLHDEHWLTLPRRKTVDLYLEPGVKRSVRLGNDGARLTDGFAAFNHPDNVIADCLLVPPSHLSDRDYDYVTADLGWPYGEGKTIRAVPYVRGLYGFSGAACAQACAFMVSALLHDHPTVRGGRGTPPAHNAGIHGLAEITALTTPPGHNFLRLRGLRRSVLIKYFSDTGHTPVDFTFGAKSPMIMGSTQPPHELAHALIAAYVRSGFSPMLLVLAHRDNEPPPLEPNHAVVIVGVSKPSDNALIKPKLIVNDPSDRPFEKWELSEFRARTSNASCPTSVICILPQAVRVPLSTGILTTSTRSAPPSAGGTTNMTSTLKAGALQMALACHGYDATGSDVGPSKPAVSDFILAQVLLDLEDSPEQTPAVALPEAFGSFGTKDESFSRAWRSSSLLRALGGRWCWVQVQRRRGGDRALLAVRVWDAELEPMPFREVWPDMVDDHSGSHSVARYKRFLLVEFRHGTPQWHAVEMPGYVYVKGLALERRYKARLRGPRPTDETPRATPRMRHRPSQPSLRGRCAEALRRWAWRSRRGNRRHGVESTGAERLTPCLITSFSATHLKLAADYWPSAVGQAELYAFMHCDGTLFPARGRGGNGDTRASGGAAQDGAMPSVAKRLSDIHQLPRKARSEEIRRISRTIREFARAANVRVNAFATFMPQLYSLNRARALEARRALEILGELRDDLEPFGHDVRTIEIVGGSLIAGLVRGAEETQAGNAPAIGDADAGELTFLAYRSDRMASYRRLCTRLRRLCRTLDASQRGSGFSLALELEPGPLFVVNDLDAVTTLAQMFRDNPVLSRRVGFNIDIAHFILAGARPEHVFQNPTIAERICHFHISDHGVGHFGDTPLGDCGFGAWCLSDKERLTLLRDWIHAAAAWAKRRAADRRPLPRFSGLISIELEAAKSPACVKRSCDILQVLLAEAYGTPIGW